MTAEGAVCIPNIGAAGIARRRRSGWIRLGAGVAASLLFLALGAAPVWHLALVFVYGLGLLGVLQARAKT